MIEDVINRIRTELSDIFDTVFDWFNVDDRLLNYAPSDGGWSVRKVLEHISLTNHFLLILIRKGVIKALEKARKADCPVLLSHYSFNWKDLEMIGKYKSFEWNRPEHMEPGGNILMEDVRQKLKLQLDECLLLLKQLENGQGILYHTTMSVNGLGKIDVYHHIYFLCQHAKRHIGQLQRIKAEFNGSR